MTMQIRPNYGQDGSLPYAPQRDLRYMYPTAVEAICNRFNNDGWPELTAYAEKRGCTAEELEVANIVFIKFLNISCEQPEEDMKQVLERAGWFKLNVEAQVAYMAMLGTVAAGQLFWALRDTTELGKEPMGMKDLLKLALDISITGCTDAANESATESK